MQRYGAASTITGLPVSSKKQAAVEVASAGNYSIAMSDGTATGSDDGGGGGLTDPARSPQSSSCAHLPNSKSDLQLFYSSSDSLTDLGRGAALEYSKPTPTTTTATETIPRQLPPLSTKSKSCSLIDQVLNCFQPHNLRYRSKSHADTEQEYIEEHLQEIYCCLFTNCEPPVSFRDYVTTLAVHTKATSVCFLMAAGYALRIEDSGVLPLTPRSLHRVYLACLVLAIKTQDDNFRKQAHYAYCGGVPIKELNDMELAAFVALEFNTTMKSADLFALVKRS